MGPCCAGRAHLLLQAQQAEVLNVHLYSLLASSRQACSPLCMINRRPGAVQVTKGGITHLAFHPAADPLLLACADKYGNLGLWQVDYTPPDAPAHSAQVGWGSGV